MSSPIYFKVTRLLTTGASSNIVGWTRACPDTKYQVSAEFSYDAGNWWITDKYSKYFTLNVENTPAGSQYAFIVIYYDNRDGGI